MASVTRTAVSPLQGGVGYELGGNEQWTPDAITATWDGSAAVGDFVVAASYYNAGGALIDRAFPEDVTNVPGDTGRTFFRPFKRGGGGAAAATLTAYEAILDPTGVLMNPNTTTSLPWVKEFGDLLMLPDGVNVPVIANAGTYVFSVLASGGPSAGNYTIQMVLRVAIFHQFQAWPTSALWQTGASSGTGPIVTTAPRAYVAGDQFEVRVRHNAGAALRIALLGGVSKLA